MGASGTFSIVARCPRSGALGVAVATGAIGVRSRVPHVAVGVGAIATQGYTEIMYGVLGLRLLKQGLEPKDVLEYLLERDAGREYRQVAIIDSKGRRAAHTGRRTPAWSGHRMGADYVVAGNLLSGEDVISAMEEAFKRSTHLNFEERLLLVLEAGERAGGDRRGELSSALLVARPGSPILDLSVDYHENPIKELRCRLEGYKRRRQQSSGLGGRPWTQRTSSDSSP